MKKLNNGGWSHITFIVLLLLLHGALIIVSLLVNQFDKKFPRYSSNIEIVTQKKSLI
jgi:hypothetical protein